MTPISKKVLQTIVLLLTVVPLLDAHMKTPDDLAALHEQYKLKEIVFRRFTQNQMLGWIQPMAARGHFSAKTIGTSAEGRGIILYTVGAGPTKVLLWSQMHGDEPTATMALLDILNFLSAAPEHAIARLIRQNLTLLMVPMINPDGAERFQRRTGQLIDMNRDALRLATPEARLLKQVRDEHDPRFGFNLHDQDPRYTVGQSKDVSGIALLAPAMNDEKTDNDVRLRAKQVAARIAEALKVFIPGHVTKYDDTFEPRAFGDNIQKWGTSTVLIESGGWRGDPEKMHLRKANFIALLAALSSIARNDYTSADVAAYESLPFNGKNLYDIILRGLTFRASPSVPPLVADVGINLEETSDSTGLRFTEATMVDLGDLSTMAAFEDIDCRGLEFDAAEIELKKSMPLQMLRDLLGQKRRR